MKTDEVMQHAIAVHLRVHRRKIRRWIEQAVCLWIEHRHVGPIHPWLSATKHHFKKRGYRRHDVR